MRLTHRFYYAVKPALPWRARMAVRRVLAAKERAAHRNSWPICASAGHPPAGWGGWPEQKDFALLLTHDIETATGVAQVRQVAELEMANGFRSSFNFIPGGEYDVPRELRDWLTSNGFEVGVHDLEHDGRLFQSQDGFTRKAVQINNYLRDWKAAGFRSGFMLRNLDWLHQLNIEYDASTFDTDPFELQSDGANTIFPFWIRNRGFDSANHNSAHSNREGYVELPYTLPQDSTLFLVLKEKSPEIWLRKADWVVQRGGMVCVNVHPDYINFGRRPNPRQYSVALYESFLGHIRRNYQGRYWHALPRDLARWYRDARPKSQGPVIAHPTTNLQGKRASVLLYSEYPADPRPRRAAEAMVEAGMSVDLLCLGSDDEPRRENVGGVNVHRISLKRSRDSKLTYFRKYSYFILRSLWFLTRKAISSRIDVVHVHNMPDVLVFSAVFAKLRGAKVILDLHDPMPEVMMSIYGLKEESFAVGVLKRTEKASIGIANSVITVNEACRKIFSRRSCPLEKVNVVMNSPDEEIFSFRLAESLSPATSHSSAYVIMYHGSIVERHGLDIAIDALRLVQETIPGAELRIYGNETPFLRKVLASITETRVRQAVHFLGPKNLVEITAEIRRCDVGIIPNRRSIFTEINTPTRIFEYLSQGKPVVAPRSPGILDYFAGEDLVFFDLGNVHELASQLVFVRKNPEAAAHIVARGQRIYQNHLWRKEKSRFLSIVSRTLRGEFASAETEDATPLNIEVAR
jgi:glycosyltransferase involved in cell wall biosynthesis